MYLATLLPLAEAAAIINRFAVSYLLQQVLR
jgi:hypothetical protein